MRKWIFDGIKFAGGHCAWLTSSPSKRAEALNVRENSTSQILHFNTRSMSARWRLHMRTPHQVPTPISATLRSSTSVGILGCKR